ncbi:MAG: hypothetical protein IAB80_09710 [Bacteroidetes bacterium]|uniref:Uncharacterized protein n=1 Tax=Candidatus Cryptobacteroides excrementipullorum TaxID=2840761 RepID=A0A9D9IX80_9BACT|nr:hypothetical protein [Candidatus Cryptobacteroides excrementipullorum]
MTVIDRISFSFRMTDEQFARDLYADWDGFCRRCVTDVMEDFFSPYDTEDSYIEIDSLDLDLGDIPQEDFMDEFPARLREALERNFIPLVRGITAGESSARQYLEGASGHQTVPSAAATEKRFENFLHYLEYGFCLPEWSGCDFDPAKESDFFKGMDYAGRIAALIVSRPHAAVRLSMLTGDADFAMDILRAVISSDAVGEYEKRRHIAATLERSPQTVIRFIHETGESGILDGMAGLIGNPQVRGIMEAETESHAEIDLPEYWYRLYGWLLEYYPFNGVPMFGDKQHFRLHLNRSLLSFIHDRTYPSYLSKAELTVQFLMAVFGAEHYIAVLDIIYHNQPLNPDGSPAGGDSYAWELYYMLMQLSLIKANAVNTDRAFIPNKDDISAIRKEPTEEERIARTTRVERDKIAYNQAKAENISSEALDQFIKHTESFGQWLEDNNIPPAVKRHLISRLVREKPDELVRWLRAGQEKRHISALASLSDDRSLSTLAGRISLQLAEIVSVISGQADNIVAHVSWLKETDRARFGQMVYLTVLEGIADGSLSASDTAGEMLMRIAERLFKEVGGAASSEDRTVPEPVREFLDAVKNAIPGLNESDSVPDQYYRPLHPDKGTAASETPASLKALLFDRSIPDSGKRLLLLQWLDTWHGDEIGLVSALYSERILEEAIDILESTQLIQIASRLTGSAYGYDGTGHYISMAVNLITDNVKDLAGIVSRPAKEIWLSLLVSLASKGKAMLPAADDNGMENIVRLLADTVGNGHIDAALEYLFHKLIPKTYPSVSESPAPDGEYGVAATDAENGSLLSLLSGIRKYIRLHDSQSPFECFLDNPAEIAEWLRDDAFPVSQKRELLRRFVSARADKTTELVRDSIISDSSLLALWLEISDISILLELASSIDSRLSSVTERIVMALQDTGAGVVILKGTSGAKRDKAITKAILLMLAEEHNTDSINTESIVRMFMDTLHFAITGSKEYTASEHQEWESAGLRIVSDIVPDTGISGTASAESPLAETESMPPASPADGQMQETLDRMLEWLMSPSVSETAKSQLLRHYARWQSGLLWRLILYSSGTVSNDSFSRTSVTRVIIPTKWASWLDKDTLLEMISGISLTLGETLRQTITAVSGKYNITDSASAEALIIFLASHPSDNVHYIEPQAVIRDYISALEPHISAGRDNTERGKIEDARTILSEVQSQKKSSIQTQERTETAEIQEEIPYSEDRNSVLDTIAKEVERELHIKNTERIIEDAVQPEYIEVPNAGLCLLAVWFTRLFDMLGLLEANADGKKDLRDTAARIRAIFILQRLVTDEKREYREQELALNRILTGCPFHVPLPKTLELTDNEIRTVESMLSGVKANWDKMKGTSVKGFQRSFIERPGKLEQREDKWVLYVEERSYDILLDSLPWSYRTIRLPWLKKKINVIWRDKEEFDFENYNN